MPLEETKLLEETDDRLVRHLHLDERHAGDLGTSLRASRPDFDQYYDDRDYEGPVVVDPGAFVPLPQYVQQLVQDGRRRTTLSHSISGSRPEIE